MRFFHLLICAFLVVPFIADAQQKIIVLDQYERPVKNAEIDYGAQKKQTDEQGSFTLSFLENDSSLNITAPGYESISVPVHEIKENKIFIHKLFSFTDLLTPMLYIKYGGIWLLLLIIFAETGLFVGFFLPGDSLLFVAGIYSKDLVEGSFGVDLNSSIFDLLLLGLLISLFGILGNAVGYWFGKKSGPFLFERKDNMLYKKKYLFQARDFYEKHGGGAIVMARFLPIVRTFAPIVAGIVQMDKKKFTFFNIVGSFAWVFSMLIAGHYLQRFILSSFGFDLKKHLEIIVLGIVFVTTAPVILKLIFGKVKK